MLGLIGAVLGGLILLCNLESRAWKKLELGYVDSGSPQSMLLAIGASLLTGLTVPYIALQSVHGGGTDRSDGKVAIDKIFFSYLQYHNTSPYRTRFKYR